MSIFIAGRLNQIASNQHASKIQSKNKKQERNKKLSNQKNNTGVTIEHGPKTAYTCSNWERIKESNFN